ncbi:MAG: LysR substrate-binding domain-containing protein, partial [Gammaproteobacteria bacterium]|nr:LysR substrate-binding domain-containing protein [Gammaproteobacteria bacterium]
VVLSGAEDAIREGSADLVISAFVPEGFLGEEIAEIEFIAVAHPSHPLHQQTTPISSSELSQSLHVIVSDSGHVQTRDVGWLSSEHRWNVAKMETAIEIISRGLGFAWLPSHLIQQQLQQGTLKALPLEAGQRYKAHLFFVKTQQEHTGPAAQTLADLFLRPTGGLPS